MGILQKSNQQTSGEHCRKDERVRDIKEIHQPVFLQEVLFYLQPKPGENFIDATVGLAGHSLAILEKNKPEGKVLGIDLNKKTLEILKKEIANERLVLIQGNFAALKNIAEENNFLPADGILLDLGMSSWQIETSGQGFSFQKDEPLLMTYQSEIDEQQLSASQIVNQWPEKELARIFWQYGQERYSRQIARAICQQRQIQSIERTSQLVEIIKKAVPFAEQRKRIHCATRVFQALRLTVNDELNNLKKALEQSLDVLRPAGRLVVISFQSLEDRIVKNFFRQSAKENQLKILTKKPITPCPEEIKINPRSRSAKLRAAVKI